MRSRYSGVYALALVMFLLSSPAAAQDLSVTGRVVDTQGGVVVNASVYLEGPSGPGRMTTSSGDGTFTFTAVSPGTFLLRVRAAGFSEWMQSVSVSNGAANVEVMLAVAGIGESIQVSADEQSTLETRVVAASRLPMTSLETPAAVHAVSGEVIRERGDRTVEDAETRMVGVTTHGSLGNGGGVAHVARLRRPQLDCPALRRQADSRRPGHDDISVRRLDGRADRISRRAGVGAVRCRRHRRRVQRRSAAAESRRPTIGQARFTVGYYDTVRAAGGVGGPLNDRVAYRVDLESQPVRPASSSAATGRRQPHRARSASRPRQSST